RRAALPAVLLLLPPLQRGEGPGRDQDRPRHGRQDPAAAAEVGRQPGDPGPELRLAREGLRSLAAIPFVRAEPINPGRRHASERRAALGHVASPVMTEFGQARPDGLGACGPAARRATPGPEPLSPRPRYAFP